MFHSTTSDHKCSPVDRNVKDFTSDEGTDIPANKGDEDLIAGKVVWSVAFHQQRGSKFGEE